MDLPIKEFFYYGLIFIPPGLCFVFVQVSLRIIRTFFFPLRVHITKILLYVIKSETAYVQGLLLWNEKMYSRIRR